jgi:hypothetical protein
MEEVAEGLETSAKVGSNIKEPQLGLMRKNKKTINTKGLCFSYHEPRHRSFQCPKRPHQVATLGLIDPKEGGKTKNHKAKDKDPIQVLATILE